MTALFAFSLAQIHGVPPDEIERRRPLVMGIMIGGSGTEAIPKIAERTGQHWAKQIVAKVPTSKLLQISKVVGRNFITKYDLEQIVVTLVRIASSRSVRLRVRAWPELQVQCLLRPWLGRHAPLIHARYGLASYTALTGVSLARRKRVRPAAVITSRIRASPAWAPSASPTS